MNLHLAGINHNKNLKPMGHQSQFKQELLIIIYKEMVKQFTHLVAIQPLMSQHFSTLCFFIYLTLLSD